MNRVSQLATYKQASVNSCPKCCTCPDAAHGTCMHCRTRHREANLPGCCTPRHVRNGPPASTPQHPTAAAAPTSPTGTTSDAPLELAPSMHSTPSSRSPPVNGAAHPVAGEPVHPLHRRCRKPPSQRPSHRMRNSTQHTAAPDTLLVRRAPMIAPVGLLAAARVHAR